MDQRKTGFTEEDIQAIEKVLEIIDPRCVWSNLKRNDFTLHRFPNGLVNDVSRCKLTDEARKRLCHTPRDYPEIAIKFFTTNARFPYCPVQRTIINTLASAKGLSPHVIYIDLKVMVQQCVTNGRMPNDTDDYDEAFFEHTARKIARFHCLEAPVAINYSEWDRFLEVCKTDFPGSGKILDGSFRDVVLSDPLLSKDSLKSLCRLNFENLYKYFFSAGLDATDSPRVFTHLDSHRDNRIVEEKVHPETGVVTKELFYIDLDFAMFHYRGIDLGVYFECYGQKEFRFGKGSWPDEGRMIEFIEIYKDECANILGRAYMDKPENRTAKIVAETKVFVMYSYFVSIWIALNAYLDPSIPPAKKQEYIRGAIVRADQFVNYHAVLLKERVLPDIGIDFYYS